MEEVDIKKSSNSLGIFVLIFLFSVVFSLGFILWNKTASKTQIVSVNVTYLLTEFKHKAINISDEKKLAKIIQSYTNILSSTLNDYAQKNNYQIVSYKVVVAGIEDKTKEVEKLIDATFKVPISDTSNDK